MLSGTSYPTGKKTRAGAGMGKNLYPHAGIGFLSGRVRVGGCGYGTTLPDGFLPVAISISTVGCDLKFVHYRMASWAGEGRLTLEYSNSGPITPLKMGLLSSLESPPAHGIHQLGWIQMSGVGGFGIRPFVHQISRSFQLVKFNSKGSAAKPRELLSPFSSLRIHLSTSTLHRQQSNQISPTVQSVRVSVRLLDFLRDETPRVNLTHPASYGSGFSWGVSSSLTSNAFKFGYDMCLK
jgi:hypothetical protein